MDVIEAAGEEDVALPHKHALPLESARVFVNGDKQTTDVRKGLKRNIRHQQAKEFYAEMELLTPRVFDEVDWEALDLALKVKSKMYNLWYGKQCFGWCATNYKLKQWKKTDNSRCLNCNGLDEKADHLMICSSKDRIRLFKEHGRKIKEWTETHYTDPDLANLVVDYLRGRNDRKIVHLGVPDHIRRLSQTQNAIGWRNFTDGKLSKSFRVIQQEYLRQEETRVTVNSWLKQFFIKLLTMSHSQWLFRCITKHHRTKGTLVLARKEELLKEIERQLDMGVDAIADKDWGMLEVEVDARQLRDTSLAEQLSVVALRAR